MSRLWKKSRETRLKKQLKLRPKKMTQMISKVVKTPIRVETLKTKETKERVAKMGTRKKEIEKRVMAQERGKIMGEDRMATTKETKTEINLIGKIPFLLLVSMVVQCKTNFD